MKRRSRATPPAFELGNAEWVALPQLGLDGLLARIDTGAKTSALHATGIEVHHVGDKARVRFILPPGTGRKGGARSCEAALLARRWVTSSNGGRELRCVISTEIEIGARRWPIELTLTNRARMRYPMLLGRQAILSDMIVRPRRGSRQARPTIAVAASAAAAEGQCATGRRIGLIGIGPVGGHWQAVADALSTRGYVVERIDVRSCQLAQRAGAPAIVLQGRWLAPLDAVLAMLEPQADPALARFAIAVVRQAEMCGAVALNGAAGLALVRDRVAATQALWAAGVPVAIEVLGADARSEVQQAAARLFSGLVVGSAAMTFAHRHRVRRPRQGALVPRAEQARLMVHAARALGLGFARVDLRLEADGSSAVVAVAAGLAWDERGGLPDAALADAIVSAIEAKLHTVACAR